MATLDSFFPFIQPAITSCPNPLVRTAILQAAIELCVDAQVWAVRTQILLETSKNTYQIPVPSVLPGDSGLVQVLNIWLGAEELTGKSFNDLTGMLPDWQTRLGNPMYFVVDNVSDGLEIYPTPDGSFTTVPRSMIVRACFAPTLTAKSVPDFILNRFADAIAFGAKARLLLMTNQPWSDAKLGAYFEDKFKNEVVQARIEQLHARSAGSITVAPRRFGRGY